MQTFITGIPPVRRNRLWRHRRGLPILDQDPIHRPGSGEQISMPSAHVLYRSCTCASCAAVTKATARRGESAAAGGVARLRRAGAFLLKP